MLTAVNVRLIIAYTAADLTSLIQATHKDHAFTAATFLGVNTVSQFVFSATQFNEEFNCDQQTKVFVYNDNGTIVAEY
jgi:hypothetical protein